VSDGEKFLSKAENELGKVYQQYFQLCHAKTLSEVRMVSIGIIYTLTYALALLNRTTVKRGRGKLKQEILAMPLVPKDFTALYDILFESTDRSRIKDACEKLVKNTQDLIEAEKSKAAKPVSFKEKLSGLYEEMINFYNKIDHACEINDMQGALFAAVELVHEFANTGVSTEPLPGIAGAYDCREPACLLETVHAHQKTLVQLLKDNGVSILELRNFEEMREYLLSLQRR